MPEFDIFGAISKENRINGVKEGVGTRHVEALGGMEVVDALDEGPALCYE